MARWWTRFPRSSGRAGRRHEARLAAIGRRTGRPRPSPVRASGSDTPPPFGIPRRRSPRFAGHQLESERAVRPRWRSDRRWRAARVPSAARPNGRPRRWGRPMPGGPTWPIGVTKSGRAGPPPGTRRSSNRIRRVASDREWSWRPGVSRGSTARGPARRDRPAHGVPAVEHAGGDGGTRPDPPRSAVCDECDRTPEGRVVGAAPVFVGEHGVRDEGHGRGPAGVESRARRSRTGTRRGSSPRAAHAPGSPRGGWRHRQRACRRREPSRGRPVAGASPGWRRNRDERGHFRKIRRPQSASGRTGRGPHRPRSTRSWPDRSPGRTHRPRHDPLGGRRVRGSRGASESLPPLPRMRSAGRAVSRGSPRARGACRRRSRPLRRSQSCIGRMLPVRFGVGRARKQPTPDFRPPAPGERERGDRTVPPPGSRPAMVGWRAKGLRPSAPMERASGNGSLPEILSIRRAARGTDVRARLTAPRPRRVPGYLRPETGVVVDPDLLAGRDRPRGRARDPPARRAELAARPVATGPDAERRSAGPELIVEAASGGIERDGTVRFGSVAWTSVHRTSFVPRASVPRRATGA